MLGCSFTSSFQFSPQKLMAAHSIICPMLMFIRIAAERDNQRRLLYFLWIPGSSGKAFVLNASTSIEDSWVGLLASCLLAVKLFEMKVNSLRFASHRKQLTNKDWGGWGKAKTCRDNKWAAELGLISAGCTCCLFHCLLIFCVCGPQFFLWHSKYNPTCSLL